MEANLHALKYFADYAHQAGAWEELFAAIEQRQLLLHKSQQSHGFASAADDLERHALAGAIQLADWDRFIHYALLAVNLRGLAESLAEEEILRALTTPA